MLAHGIEVVHNSLGDDMAKLAALPEPWNNVGDIWARAKYDFPIRAHFGVFAEEYSRIEGVDERAKFLDLLMSGCKVRGIPAFIWKFPDMDPGNALRNITDSDQRVKFFAVSTLIFCCCENLAQPEFSSKADSTDYHQEGFAIKGQ